LSMMKFAVAILLVALFLLSSQKVETQSKKSSDKDTSVLSSKQLAVRTNSAKTQFFFLIGLVVRAVVTVAQVVAKHYIKKAIVHGIKAGVKQGIKAGAKQGIKSASKQGLKSAAKNVAKDVSKKGFKTFEKNLSKYGIKAGKDGVKINKDKFFREAGNKALSKAKDQAKNKLKGEVKHRLSQKDRKGMNNDIKAYRKLQASFGASFGGLAAIFSGIPGGEKFSKRFKDIIKGKREKMGMKKVMGGESGRLMNERLQKVLPPKLLAALSKIGKSKRQKRILQTLNTQIKDEMRITKKVIQI